MPIVPPELPGTRNITDRNMRLPGVNAILTVNRHDTILAFNKMEEYKRADIGDLLNDSSGRTITTFEGIVVTVVGGTATTTAVPLSSLPLPPEPRSAGPSW